MIRYRTLVPFVLLASSLFAAPVFAAPPCATNNVFSQHRVAHMQQNHRKLHDSLKLAPEQEGAWKKLMDTQGPMLVKGECDKAEGKTRLTTPEREEQWLKRMNAHMELMAEHVDALKDFYAELSPQQQKTFDDFHAGPRIAKHPRPARHERRSSTAGRDAYLASPKP